MSLWFSSKFAGAWQRRFLDCHSVNDKATFGGNNGKCDLVSIKHVRSNLNIVQIFPNPVVDESFLKMPEDMYINRVVVYDVLGRIVKSFDVNNDIPELLKNDYSKGVYFMHVFHQQQLVALTKFVVN